MLSHHHLSKIQIVQARKWSEYVRGIHFCEEMFNLINKDEDIVDNLYISNEIFPICLNRSASRTRLGKGETVTSKRYADMLENFMHHNFFRIYLTRKHLSLKMELYAIRKNNHHCCWCLISKSHTFSKWGYRMAFSFTILNHVRILVVELYALWSVSG